MNTAGSKERRKAIVRTAILLVAVALAVYFSFILISVVRA